MVPLDDAAGCAKATAGFPSMVPLGLMSSSRAHEAEGRGCTHIEHGQDTAQPPGLTGCCWVRRRRRLGSTGPGCRRSQPLQAGKSKEAGPATALHHGHPAKDEQSGSHLETVRGCGVLTFTLPTLFHGQSAESTPSAGVPAGGSPARRRGAPCWSPSVRNASFWTGRYVPVKGAKLCRWVGRDWYEGERGMGGGWVGVAELGVKAGGKGGKGGERGARLGSRAVTRGVCGPTGCASAGAPCWHPGSIPIVFAPSRGLTAVTGKAMGAESEKVVWYRSAPRLQGSAQGSCLCRKFCRD